MFLLMKSVIFRAKSIVKKSQLIRKIVLKHRYKKYLKKLSYQKSIGNDGGPKVLIINHHFDQDVETLIKGCSKEFQFFDIHCMPFFNQGELFFLTDDERDGVIPYGNLPSELTQKYRKVCYELFKDLRNIFSFELIIIPSDSFWWIREFLSVAAEFEIKRIVLDKEGLQTPYCYDTHPAQIKDKFPFMSDYLLVWSTRQRDFWIRAGVPEEIITVIGQPRSDFFFEKERWKSKSSLGLDDMRRMILFFYFRY